MSSDYEKTLEDENARLHAELEELRKLIFDLAPRLEKVFTDMAKDVHSINNGYFERGQGCLALLRKIETERKYIAKEFFSK